MIVPVGGAGVGMIVASMMEVGESLFTLSSLYSNLLFFRHFSILHRLHIFGHCHITVHLLRISWSVIDLMDELFQLGLKLVVDTAHLWIVNVLAPHSLMIIQSAQQLVDVLVRHLNLLIFLNLWTLIWINCGHIFENLS